MYSNRQLSYMNFKLVENKNVKTKQFVEANKEDYIIKELSLTESHLDLDKQQKHIMFIYEEKCLKIIAARKKRTIENQLKVMREVASTRKWPSGFAWVVEPCFPPLVTSSSSHASSLLN